MLLSQIWLRRESMSKPKEIPGLACSLYQLRRPYKIYLTKKKQNWQKSAVFRKFASLGEPECAMEFANELSVGSIN